MSNLKESELTSILRFGLTYQQVSAFDILCLPENISTVSNSDELFDTSDAINLSKLLKIKGLNCANSYDLHLNAQVFERRSKEKWFGTIYIRNNVVIPIFVGVLSSVIANEISDIVKDAEQPIPKVHIELKIEKPNNVTNLKYDGDAQTLITILKGIEMETNSNSKK